jgi:ribosomal subunit interface protein
MSLTITGKNFDIGEALRGQVEATVETLADKYFDGRFSGQVVLEHDGPGYRADVVLHLATGITLQASGTAMEAPLAFDQAADRIDKRLRRYKSRLSGHDHSYSMGGPTDAARTTIIAAPAGEDEIPVDYSPVIVAEETTQLRTLTVAGAVLAMDLSGAPVLVFRNAGGGGINVVYRRSDGNIGWIDPTFSPAGDSSNG